MQDAEERVRKATEVLLMWSGTDGAHHKMWTLDQVLRALTGCPEVEKTYQQGRETYTAVELGESEEYRQVIAAYCDGEDGPDTYEWDTGIAP